MSERGQIPSPEEFERRRRGHRGPLRPIVRLVERLRLRPGVGAQKRMATPGSPEPQAGLPSPGGSATGRPRRIVFRDGVRSLPSREDTE